MRPCRRHLLGDAQVQGSGKPLHPCGQQSSGKAASINGAREAFNRHDDLLWEIEAIADVG